MEDDIFNEFQSEDGSGDLVAHSIPCSSNFRVKSRMAERLTDDDDEDMEREIYREKYRKIKKISKGLIFGEESVKDEANGRHLLRPTSFRHRGEESGTEPGPFQENACLCDEVAQLQEKIVIAKEERRFLLRKLLSFEVQKEKDGNSANMGNCTVPGGRGLQNESSEPQTKRRNPVKKKPQQKTTDESPRPRSKKKKPPAEKRIVQPIPLDCSGRPIFPIVLGSLTVHSLGVIIYDRLNFHDENSIFPVGYCSSRMYISLKNPLQQCLYTCTIMDSSFGPRFEITPEDNPDHPIIGSSLNECHSFLLSSINILCGRELVNSEGQGAKFFGLSHPIVQNLIQSCAGARKCLNYRWVQFEVSRPKDDGNKMCVPETDPTINYDALQKLMLEST